MSRQRAIILTFLGALLGLALVASAALGDNPGRRDVNGTIWVANRGANTIRGFDAATGDVVMTVAMRPGSQPGDLAYAKGKLYVAEEFGTPPAIAIVDAHSGEVLSRIFTTGPRPHHVHASAGGNLIAFGEYGTNKIGVIDTHTDTLLGEWQASTNPGARSHAAVFAPDGRTVYVANELVNELAALDPVTGEQLWRMDVPFAHELFVAHNGKTAFVSGRVGNALDVVDLERHEIVCSIPLGPMPDTFGVSPNEKLLTLSLRGTPAQVAIVDTETLDFDIVTIGARERSPATNGPHRTDASHS